MPASKKSAKPAVAAARATPSGRTSTSTGEPHRWTFLTNHSHVLVLIKLDPHRVLREIAREVGITERAVQRIIVDLEEGGFIERKKVGRQNHYQVKEQLPLRHPIEAHRSIGDLLQLLTPAAT